MREIVALLRKFSRSPGGRESNSITWSHDPISHPSCQPVTPAFEKPAFQTGHGYRPVHLQTICNATITGRCDKISYREIRKNRIGRGQQAVYRRKIRRTDPSDPEDTGLISNPAPAFFFRISNSLPALLLLEFSILRISNSLPALLLLEFSILQNQ